MPDETLLQVLDELSLNYDLDLDIPEADCPKDQSHKMLIDPVNRKTETMAGSFTGLILTLKLFKSEND